MTDGMGERKEEDGDGRSERSAAAAAPRARGLPLVAGPALESERELSLAPAPYCRRRPVPSRQTDGPTGGAVYT